MTAKLKIGVVGAAGRMGCTVVKTVAASNDCIVVAACEAPGRPQIGEDAGVLAGLPPLGVEIGADAESVFAAADAVIDFTVPDATVVHATLAARSGTALVAGTTGLAAAHEEALREAAVSAPILYAPNMSVAVNLLFALTEQVARILGPEEYDIEIAEMHHRYKVDAPSGTALALGRAAARGRDVALDAVAARGRDGHTGARAPGAIGFAVLRGGDVAGEHSVLFAADGERLELAHRATDRGIFARGAVRGARWLRGRPPGLYSMRDVLGL